MKENHLFLSLSSKDKSLSSLKIVNWNSAPVVFWPGSILRDRTVICLHLSQCLLHMLIALSTSCMIAVDKNPQLVIQYALHVFTSTVVYDYHISSYKRLGTYCYNDGVE